MRLTDLIKPELIVVPLKAKDKEGVIAELIAHTAEAGEIKDPARVNEAVLQRESLGSTGLENGIAIPHAKSDAVESVVLSVGVSPTGVEFEALDGAPSKIFFLILAPPDKSGIHVEVLSEIALVTRSDTFLKLLENAGDPYEVAKLFQDS